MKSYFFIVKRNTNSNGRVGKIKVCIFLPALLLLMFFTDLSGQTVQSLDVALSADTEELQHLESLINDLNPTVYLQGTTVKAFGNGFPLVAECDTKSIGLLYDGNSLFNQVELIRIKIASSLEMAILTMDLNNLTGFPNLKYLYLIYTFDACGDQADGCLAENAGKSITGNESPVTVLYSLSIPR